MPQLSRRLSMVKPSSTLAVTAKVLELRSSGAEVIGFAAGEPDFDTWPEACQAAHDAISGGQFRYTAVGGTPALKEAICLKLSRDNGLEYKPNEVMASCGGKHSLYTAMQAVLNEGDDVLIISPHWVSYPDMAALNGGVPRFVTASEESDFLLEAEQLRAALRPETRLVILNSPSNPTGATYDEARLAGLARVLAEHDCWVVADDVYEFIRYDGGRPPHLLTLEPTLRERTIISNSVSKTYAMTGWRIGYTAAPQPVIKAMTTLQGQSTSNPSTIAQAAAAAVLAGPQDRLGPMVAEFERRRDVVCDRINAIDGLSVVKPGGAFYVFVNAQGILDRTGSADGDELAMKLLDGAQVGVVGGNSFGSKDHFRISYATSLELLESGLDRIQTWLSAL